MSGIEPSEAIDKSRFTLAGILLLDNDSFGEKRTVSVSEQHQCDTSGKMSSM